MKIWDDDDFNSLEFKSKNYLILFFIVMMGLIFLFTSIFKDVPREGKVEGYDLIKKMVNEKRLSEKEYDRLFHNNKKYMRIKKDFFN